MQTKATSTTGTFCTISFLLDAESNYPRLLKKWLKQVQRQFASPWLKVISGADHTFLVTLQGKPGDLIQMHTLLYEMMGEKIVQSHLQIWKVKDFDALQALIPPHTAR